MSTTGPDGPRLSYRAPESGIAAPEDYPNAPISLVIEGSTPGADLFGVAVAIGGHIPLHYHSMMEFQYVVSGTGLALNADGDEIPIGPGGTVLSPGGAAGAHGFVNTGTLPLTLLCLYPCPGGATPDRFVYDREVDPGDGPRTTYVGPDDLRPSAGASARILDETDPGAELHAFTVAVAGEASLHHHHVFQMAYVVTGSGIVADADGRETPIAPGGIVSCPAGPSGAHAFRSTGTLPLQLLHVSPSPDGSAPEAITGA